MRFGRWNRARATICHDGLLKGTWEPAEVGCCFPRALSRPPKDHLQLKLSVETRVLPFGIFQKGPS